MNKKNNKSSFQKIVDQYLVQHRSIFDVLTKYQESNARVNRAIAKASTQCGCIKIKSEKQTCPPDVKLNEISKYMNSQVEGSLCDNCKEIIETEMGSNLFYTAAICNILDLNLDDVTKKEKERIATLGIYNLS
ncbi:MAG: DUF1573 domain-containing protein [Candidatus Caldatribacteriota bacterium]|nr:DUF1573 domain-containing protein [Candidatus Caldatribacteriota bacterium]